MDDQDRLFDGGVQAYWGGLVGGDEQQQFSWRQSLHGRTDCDRGAAAPAQPLFAEGPDSGAFLLDDSGGCLEELAG